MSEHRARRLVELDCSSCRCEPRADHNGELREELLNLARQKPRYGYRRLHVLLRKCGQVAKRERSLLTRRDFGKRRSFKAIATKSLR
jgi:putative transposase